MILTRTCTTRSRRGFTLVELMVAAALAITIMWILAESFKMGIDFARSARSTGDMMTQLNNVGQIMTRDLQGNHFNSSPTVTNSNGKLVSQRADLLVPSGGSLVNTYTPPYGFFQIYSPPPSLVVFDNVEGFAINTLSATTLQFTAYLPNAGYSQNLFTTTVGGTVYTSQAAEVAYFLGSPPIGGGAGVPTGMTPPTPGLASQPLYNLYRRQRLVAVTSDDQVNLNQAVATDTSPWLNSAEVISVTPGGTPTIPPTVNTLASFANSSTARVAPYVGTTSLIPSFATLSNNYGRMGDDIVLSNVLSFEVLANWTPNSFLASLPTANPASVTSPRLFGTTPGTNSNYPYDYLSVGSLNPAVPSSLFDTWFQAPNWNNLTAPTSGTIPMPIRVTSLQITIRVYDPKTQQARQNSWRIAM